MPIYSCLLKKSTISWKTCFGHVHKWLYTSLMFWLSSCRTAKEDVGRKLALSFSLSVLFSRFNSWWLRKEFVEWNPESLNQMVAASDGVLNLNSYFFSSSSDTGYRVSWFQLGVGGLHGKGKAVDCVPSDSKECNFGEKTNKNVCVFLCIYIQSKVRFKEGKQCTESAAEKCKHSPLIH